MAALPIDVGDEDLGPWQLDAACRGEPVDAFFPETQGVPPEVAALCASCDVRAECLDHGLRYETEGIWGGTSPTQRRRLRRVQGISIGPAGYAAQAAELYEAGWTIDAIAVELETTTRSVWRYLDDAGHPVTPPQNWRRRPRLEPPDTNEKEGLTRGRD